MRRRKERTESSEGEERYYGKDGVTKSRALGVVILMGAFLFFQVAVFIRKEKRGEEKQAETALPFEFNPNTISSDSLVLLGFTQKQAQVVLNYRASGGRFRKKEDFAKIYSVSEEMFKKLYNYIAIPTVPEDVTRKTAALADGRPEKQDERRYSGKTEVRQWKYRQRTPRDTAGRSGASRLPERKKRVVELNGADSAELVKLYGIGGYYAKRIIEYRERLGNFYTPEQLMEIRGIDSTRFSGFKNNITADTSKIRKFSLDTASRYFLSSHPYIGSYVTRGILLLRQRFGAEYCTLENLEREGLLTSEATSALRHYIIEK